MNNFNALSLNFLTNKPQAAASVLQSLSSDQAADYLQEVPVRTLALVLQNMEIWPAARILDLFSLEKNTAIFAQLNYQNVAALLRLQAAGRRAELLQTLPAKLSRPLTLSLTYQDNSVGAWMDMSTPQFFEELSAWECLALLKKMELPFGSTLTVINNKHHVAGVVTLDVLLLSPDGKELGALMDSSITPLPAEMSLKMAKSSQDWHRHSVLPVRSAQGIYLGALSRATLSTVLQGSQQAGTTELLGDSMLAHLGTAMASSAAGLLALSSSSNVEALKVAWPKPDAHKPSEQSASASATATETATEGTANGN